MINMIYIYIYKVFKQPNTYLILEYMYFNFYHLVFKKLYFERYLKKE